MYQDKVPQLPPGLKEFMLGTYEFFDLEDFVLPDSIEVLDLSWCYHFSQSLDSAALPASLRSVRLPERYEGSLAKLHSTVQVQRVAPRIDVSACNIY
jgi:hypothetical protein